MKSKRNEHIFNQELEVFEYLVFEYRKELKLTKPYYGDKEYKATSKSRLRRLRLEINKLLKGIEDNVSTGYMEAVE